MQGVGDLVEKTVLVKLESNEALQFAGVPEDGPFFCKVTAVDQVGMWVENRKFVTIEVRDSRGRYVSEEKQEPVRHIVNILIPWRIVRAVVEFSGENAGEISPNLLGEEKSGKGTIGFIG